MRKWEKECTICKQAIDNIYSKCDKCYGVQTKEELSKLSVDDQIQLYRKLEEQEVKSRREQYNLRDQCQHLRLINKHWYYDQWTGEWLDNNRAHHCGPDDDTHVWCAVCNRDFGWQCPKNPKGYCEYPSNLEEESKYKTTILYCAHCKRPKDRMGYYSSALLGGKYDPSYEPSKEEVEEYIQKLTERSKEIPLIEPENSVGYTIKYARTK